MLPLLGCPGLLAEEACFSGRLPVRTPSSSSSWSGGLPQRSRVVRLCGARDRHVVKARFDASHGVAPRERPPAEMHTAARLRLYSLISRVQG